jgi:ubiquinone/menaquinone biosynthesis C-methylase UbiE
MIPKKLRTWIKRRVFWVIDEPLTQTRVMKYVPYLRQKECYAIPRISEEDRRAPVSELPIPPQPLWMGYGKTTEDYLRRGKTHADAMLELVAGSGLTLSAGSRILDFGCGTGRLIRHLNRLADTCEITGVDINAEWIYWCKEHLSPPFHFATTTTIPHLPFEDRYFDLIYCGSVFTHIDDLTDAWLLELRRVLSPQGRLYLTIHDQHTSALFDGPLKDSYGAKYFKSHEFYNAMKDSSAMLVIGRDSLSQVFYDIDYFCRQLSQVYDVLSVTEEAYSYQTAIVVSRKRAAHALAASPSPVKDSIG